MSYLAELIFDNFILRKDTNNIMCVAKNGQKCVNFDSKRLSERLAAFFVLNYHPSDYMKQEAEFKSHTLMMHFDCNDNDAVVC